MRLAKSIWNNASCWPTSSGKRSADVKHRGSPHGPAGRRPHDTADDIPQTANFATAQPASLLTADVLALTRDKDIGVRQQALATLSSPAPSMPNRTRPLPGFASCSRRTCPGSNSAAQGLGTMMAVVDTMRLPSKGGVIRIMIPIARSTTTPRSSNTHTALEEIHQAALGLESMRWNSGAIFFFFFLCGANSASERSRWF